MILSSLYYLNYLSFRKSNLQNMSKKIMVFLTFLMLTVFSLIIMIHVPILQSQSSIISSLQSQAPIIHKLHPKNFARVLPYTLDPAFNLSMNQEKRFVILVTSFRSGSTFLGKMFDENPLVQYLFEPLHSTEVNEMFQEDRILGASRRHTDRELKMLYLQQILHNCTVYGSGYYYERWRLCGDTRENLERFGVDECPKRGPSTFSGICMYRPTSVMKVIRLRRASDLLLLKNIKDADVRIIHYTRHPTGVMTSRNKGGRFFTWNERTKIEGPGLISRDEGVTRLAWTSYLYCKEALEFQRMAERERWLKERYLYATHQQLSLEPVRTAELIYKHIGLELTPELVEFLNHTTSGSANEQQVQEQMMTSRVSKDVIVSWKKMERLQHKQLRAIDSMCRKMIDVANENISLDPLSFHELSRLYYPGD